MDMNIPPHIPHEQIDYEAVVAHLSVGICVVRQRRILSCNQAFSDTFGHAGGALAGQSLALLFPTYREADRMAVRSADALEQGGLYADEHILKRADGSLFWCQLTGIRPAPREPHGVTIWTCRDMSSSRPLIGALSPREREVAGLMAEGMTSKLIARATGLSPRTVEMYRARLKKKHISTKTLVPAEWLSQPLCDADADDVGHEAQAA